MFEPLLAPVKRKDETAGSGGAAQRMDAWMRRVRRIHFVGVGGAGMGGIAEVLCNLGFTVSGSDLAPGAMTTRLAGLGVRIAIGHAADNVAGADVVVTSTAVAESNPEIVAARERGIPVVPRAQMLAELMRFRHGVAVAGTHGKTTTTSLVASLLAEGGLDPTFVVGGRLNSWGTNARLGTGRYLVAEADESDASFLVLQPVVAVVTNIDADHMETYGGDFGRLKQAFAAFLQRLPFYGLAVTCHDDANVNEVMSGVSKPFVTYGLDAGAGYRAVDLEPQGLRTRFRIEHGGDPDWLRVTVNLPGHHNVRNALAAVAVANELGVAQESIAAGLESFSGIARRLQVLGELDAPCGPVTLVDDYGHHPTEIAATLQAVRAAWPERRVVAVFQPHRFTRTRDLFEDFARVLSELDALVLLEVYPAGEAPVAGADGRTLSRAVRARGRVDPVFTEQVADVGDVLEGVLRAEDVLLTLGAGSVGTLPGALVERWGLRA